MMKKLLFLACTALVISCENESEDLLTKDKWVLDNGLISMKETVKFNTDKTYIIESGVKSTRFTNYYITGTLTGDWSRQEDQILFINSLVNLPDDTSSISILPTTTGSPMGAFYGYIAACIYQSDSSLINNSGTIHFDDLNDIGIFTGENSKQRIWIIKKLTRDSLIIDSDGKALKYFAE